MDVPTITRLLAAEGVTSIVITTPEPRSYRGIELAAAARVSTATGWRRSRRSSAASTG